MESLGFWVIENYKWARTLGPAWVVDGFLTLAIHEIIYFGAYIPFFIAEFIPSLRKYKIQQVNSYIIVFLSFSSFLLFFRPSQSHQNKDGIV